MIAETKDMQDTIRELTVTELDQVAGGNLTPPHPHIEVENSFNNNVGSFNFESFNGIAVSGVLNSPA